MATQDGDTGKEWGVQYPENWPVYTPYEKESTIEKQKEKAQKEAQNEIGYDCPVDSSGAGGVVENESPNKAGDGTGAHSKAVNPERQIWVGLAGLREAALTIEGGREETDSDKVDEQALLTK